MSKTAVFEGGCLCGNIRFSAKSPVLNPHTCSCRQCQRHSGALTQVWVEFASDDLIWSGTGGKPSVWRSSEYSSRAFCPNCGSTIGAIDDEPIIAIALGVFDKPILKSMAPQGHSYISRRPKWWQVDVVDNASSKPK